jgi:hypothetical protein
MQLLQQGLRLTVLLREARAQSLPERIASPGLRGRGAICRTLSFVGYVRTFRSSRARSKTG